MYNEKYRAILTIRKDNTILCKAKGTKLLVEMKQDISEDANYERAARLMCGVNGWFGDLTGAPSQDGKGIIFILTPR